MIETTKENKTFLLALFYLVFPSLLFNCFYLKWYISCLSFIPFFMLFSTSRISFKFVVSRQLILQLLFSILFTLATGAGGFLYQSPDFAEKHNPIMKSLITEIWPVIYSVEINNMNVSGPMVYYIAFYMPGILLGNLAGWFFLNVGLVIWQALGCFVCIKLLDVVTPGKWIYKTLFFLLFGGMDVVGYFFKFGHIGPWTMHLEWWAEFFQFPAMISAIHPSPQHTLPGWILGISLVGFAKRKLSVEIVACQILASLFWSPFVFIGAGLLFIINMNFKILRICFHSSVLYLTLFCVMPQILYIASTRGQVLKMFIWQEPTFVWWMYPIFIFLEIGLWIYLGLQGVWCRKFQQSMSSVVYGNNIRAEMKLLVLAIFILLIFPLVVIGRYSDLCMRGTMPALTILCIYAWEFFYLKSKELKLLELTSNIIQRLQHFWSQLTENNLRLKFLLLCFCLYLSWFNAYREMLRSTVVGMVRGPSMVSIEHVRSIYELQSDLVAQYIGNKDSFFFNYLSR